LSTKTIFNNNAPFPNRTTTAYCLHISRYNFSHLAQCLISFVVGWALGLSAKGWQLLSILEKGQAVEIKYLVIESKCSSNAALRQVSNVPEGYNYIYLYHFLWKCKNSVSATYIVDKMALLPRRFHSTQCRQLSHNASSLFHHTQRNDDTV